MRKIFLGFIGVLVIGCVAYKPARVLAPSVFGLSCISETVCLEDPESAEQANALVADALEFVERELGPIKTPPRFLFCSTADCFSRFGNPQVRAINVGTSGIVINETGWLDYIVTHELIHHWQNETFGRLKASVTLPRWYVEGMAYSMSEDPRRPLPRQDIEGWRKQFEAWVAEGKDWRVPPS